MTQAAFRVLPTFVLAGSYQEICPVREGHVYIPRLVNPPASLPLDGDGRSFCMVYLPTPAEGCSPGSIYLPESTDRSISASDAQGLRALPGRFAYVDFKRFYCPADGQLLLIGGGVPDTGPITVMVAYLVRLLRKGERPPPWELTYQMAVTGVPIPLQVPAGGQIGANCVPGATAVTALQPCTVTLDYGGGVTSPIIFSANNLGTWVSTAAALTATPSSTVQLRFLVDL